MNNLPVLDISIILLYLVVMIVIGIYFSRRNKNTDQFTRASGKIPGWAIGLSIYATFLSSNTFLGVPARHLAVTGTLLFLAFPCLQQPGWHQNILFPFTGTPVRFLPTLIWKNVSAPGQEPMP
jgi:hypothetical protein